MLRAWIQSVNGRKPFGYLAGSMSQVPELSQVVVQVQRPGVDQRVPAEGGGARELQRAQARFDQAVGAGNLRGDRAVHRAAGAVSHGERAGGPPRLSLYEKVFLPWEF